MKKKIKRSSEAKECVPLSTSISSGTEFSTNSNSADTKLIDLVVSLSACETCKFVIFENCECESASSKRPALDTLYYLN